MATLSRIIGPAIVLVLALASGALAQTHTIFVDRSSTAADADGSADAPFKTITQALELARKIRYGDPVAGISPSPEKISICVAPGQYVGSFAPSDDPCLERLPLLLNVSCLEIRGGTLLVQRGGLPISIVDGTATTLSATAPQGQKQYFVLATRTYRRDASGALDDSQELAGDDVTVLGLHFQADPARQLPSALLAFDGVSGFVARGNAFVDGANGIFTRLSSGRIEGNLVVGHAVAFYLTGGSRRFPARLEVRGNRALGGPAAVAGLGLLGAGETTNRRAGLDYGANPFGRVPLPLLFDRENDPDGVPDAIEAEIVRNMFKGHSFGIRCVGYLQNPYVLPVGQDETARITALFCDNVSTKNGLYGLVVDAGFIPLGDRRRVSFDLSFENTVLDGSEGPAIFSLWALPGSTGDETFKQLFPTFVHRSRIRACGDVTRFHYDNRQDPDPTTNPHAPLENCLTVNDVELTGIEVERLVTVPAAPPGCGKPGGGGSGDDGDGD